MNKLFNLISKENIKNIINLSRLSSLINHSGIKGKIREEGILIEILKNFLPFGVELITNQIITDNEGNQSQEVDGVVYTKSVLSPLIISTHSLFIPIESVIYTFEIKSLVTNKEVKDSIKKAKSINNLKYTEDYPLDVGDSMGFFAYSSNLKSDSDEEFKRFISNQSDFYNNPSIPAICIVGKGYWYNENTNKKWYFVKSTKDYEEVVAFIAHVVNSISQRIFRRPPCLLGHYLIKDIAKEFSL
jgi:hypothetical protein